MAQMNREGTNFKSGSLFFPDALDNVGHCIKYTAFKHNGQKLDEGIVDTFLQMPMEFPADGLSLNWNTEADVLSQIGVGSNTSISDMKSAGAAIKSARALGKRKAMGGVDKAAGIAGALIGSEGEDIKKSVQKRMGQSINTFQEQFFEGPSFRSFEFSHELIAHNQSETVTISDIVKRFRYYASPGMGSSAVTHMHWTYPSYWAIWFLTREENSYVDNDFMPKLGKCVLKEVTADYSGETYGTFSNNAPLSVKLSLSFEETTLVDKKAIEDREGVRR